MFKTLLASTFCAGLVCASAIAVADPSASTTSMATASAAPATAAAVGPAKLSRDDEIICRMATPTGSRLGGKRVCASRRDWLEQSNLAKRSMLDTHPLDTMHH